jgi:hypothetical protein
VALDTRLAARLAEFLRGLRGMWVYLAVFACAALVRVAFAFSRDRFTGSQTYDEWVHYAAAAEVLEGRLPYVDFTLAHPPGMVWALWPIAWLGRAAGTEVAVLTGRVIANLVGCLAAVGVTWAVRGRGRLAQCVAGGVFAFWCPQVLTDGQLQLEPLCVPALIAAGLLASRPAGVARRRARTQAVGIGLLVGWALTVKIVAIGPAVAILGFVLLSRGRKAFGLAAGATASIWLAATLPFAARAPGAFAGMVFWTQAARPKRWHVTVPGLGFVPQALTAVVVAGAAVAVFEILRRAWRRGDHRPIVMWFAWGVAALGEAVVHPVRSDDSLVWLTPAIAFGAAHAVGWVRDRRPARRRRRVATALVGAVTLAAAPFMGWCALARLAGEPVPDQFSTAHQALEELRLWEGACVWSHRPQSLVLSGALHADIRAGCPVWVDPYGMDLARSAGVAAPEGAGMPIYSVDGLLAAGLETAAAAWVERGSDWEEAAADARGFVKVASAGRFDLYAAKELAASARARSDEPSAAHWP